MQLALGELVRDSGVFLRRLPDCAFEPVALGTDFGWISQLVCETTTLCEHSVKPALFASEQAGQVRALDGVGIPLAPESPSWLWQLR